MCSFKVVDLVKQCLFIISLYRVNPIPTTKAILQLEDTIAELLAKSMYTVSLSFRCFCFLSAACKVLGTRLVFCLFFNFSS